LRIDPEAFEEMVVRAVQELPEEFRDDLINLDVVVEEIASPEQLARAGLRGGYDLLGLYEGVPRTRRGRGYGMVLPDKITIFQRPIESRCRNEADVWREVAGVVRHEIAHHFGISDERLGEIERRGRGRSVWRRAERRRGEGHT
jgi:predicted Zn-dependent protease with MMP-like domain